MPALFTQRANALARTIITVLLAIAIAVPGAAMIWVRTPVARGQNRAVQQPIPFDHRVHARGLQINCVFCHSGAERTASAGLPSTAACLGCHSGTWQASATFAPVRRSVATSTSIPWKRVTSVPDFVYFNHAAHVSKGVTCAHCHGDVASMAVVMQVQPLTMKWCVDCHQQSANVPGRRTLTNCSTCHR